MKEPETGLLHCFPEGTCRNCRWYIDEQFPDPEGDCTQLKPAMVGNIREYDGLFDRLLHLTKRSHTKVRPYRGCKARRPVYTVEHGRRMTQYVPAFEEK